MKQLFILFVFTTILTACNTTPAPENTNTSKETVTETTPDNRLAEASLEISPLGIIKDGTKRFTEKEGSGALSFEVDFGKGVVLHSEKGYFSGVEWSCTNFELKKDGNRIYYYPDFEADMLNVLFRNPKFEPEYPKMLSKGDQHLLLILRVVDTNSTQIDGIKIDAGKYTGYLPNLARDNQPLNEKLANELFEKAFGG